VLLPQGIARAAITWRLDGAEGSISKLTSVAIGLKLPLASCWLLVEGRLSSSSHDTLPRDSGAACLAWQLAPPGVRSPRWKGRVLNVFYDLALESALYPFHSILLIKSESQSSAHIQKEGKKFYHSKGGMLKICELILKPPHPWNLAQSLCS
jgi:hypothetical protein